MRIQTTITELSDAQWAHVQRNVMTGYPFAGSETRVCVTFVKDAEERHAEMPMVAYGAMLMGLALVPAVDSLRRAIEGLDQEALAAIRDEDDLHARPAGADQ